MPDHDTHVMLPAPRGGLCTRVLGQWAAENERLLPHVMDTPQLLLYRRPFSGGQARSPEAVPVELNQCPQIAWRIDMGDGPQEV